MVSAGALHNGSGWPTVRRGKDICRPADDFAMCCVNVCIGVGALV